MHGVRQCTQGFKGMLQRRTISPVPCHYAAALHVKQTESPRDLKEPLQQPKNKGCIPGCMITILLCDVLTSPFVLRAYDAEKSWQNDAHVVHVLDDNFFRVDIGLTY